MISILRDALAGPAAPADGASARPTPARRRRATILVGATCLVLVTAGAAAAGLDVLGRGSAVTLDRTVSGESPPPAPGTPVDPETSPVAALPALDPAATFPQCGAPVESPRPDPEIGWRGGDGLRHQPVDASGRSEVSLTPTAYGSSVTVYPTTAPALAIVRDGVVVGTSMPDGQVWVPASPPQDLVSGDEVVGTVLYRACSPGTADAGLLPAGHYSLWASQTFYVTERAVSPPGGGPLVPEDADEEVVALSRVTDVWIGADGGPVANPGPTAGWPTAVPEDVLVQPSADARTVVWVDAATFGDPNRRGVVDEAQEKLAAVGYGGSPLPFMCQKDAAEQLGIGAGVVGGTGAAVVFATRGEAAAFVELFAHPVRAVVEGVVFCDFS
ncbi:hypothetical protein [Sanguibacter sp. 25GB23B1]|uniref:hypothetical protein n=1 Tax=unclassified Sanguibacter TaxID=2645534 RepID=UPI0032AFF4F5